MPNTYKRVRTGGNLLASNSEEIACPVRVSESRERGVEQSKLKLGFAEGPAAAHLALSRPTIDRSNHVRQQAVHAVSNRELKPM